MHDSYSDWFLVGAFSLKENNPTTTAGSFFFSWQPHSEWSTFYNFHDSWILAGTKFINNCTKACNAFLQSSKKLNGTKGYSLRVFSALWDFFSKNSPKGPPSIFFDDLRHNGWNISKCPPWCANSVQLLSFSGTVEDNTLTLWSPFAIFEP